MKRCGLFMDYWIAARKTRDAAGQNSQQRNGGGVTPVVVIDEKKPVMFCHYRDFR
jgi:hypothetical protein